MTTPARVPATDAALALPHSILPSAFAVQTFAMDVEQLALFDDLAVDLDAPIEFTLTERACED